MVKMVSNWKHYFQLNAVSSQLNVLTLLSLFVDR